MAHDRLFEALAHPTRRRLLLLLARDPQSAGDLAAYFDESRPAVSRHLRVLLDAGLVSTRRDGQRRVYSIEARPLAQVDEWLATLRPLWIGRPGLLASKSGDRELL